MRSPHTIAVVGIRILRYGYVSADTYAGAPRGASAVARFVFDKFKRQGVGNMLKVAGGVFVGLLVQGVTGVAPLAFVTGFAVALYLLNKRL